MDKPLNKPPNKPLNRRSIRWIASLAAVGGLLGLLALPFIVDEAPPNDAHLRPARREVPRETNGFFAVNLTDEEMDALLEKEEISEEEREKERVCDPFTEGWDLERADRIVKKNRRLLEKFDECLRYPDFQLPQVDQLDEPFRFINFPHRIGSLVPLRAASLFERGREDEALEDSLNLIRFGDRMQGADGVLIHYLIGGTTKDRGLACLTRFIERTNVDDRVVQGILDRIPPFHESGWKVALCGEYRIIANLVDRLSRGEDVDLDLPTVLPMWLVFKPQETKRILGDLIQTLLDPPVLFPVREKQRVMDARRARVAGSGWFPTNPMGRAICSTAMGDSVTFPTLGSGGFHLLAPKLAFALRRYHRDRGSLPGSLDDLLLAYLNEVPSDPFDGAKLRYSKEKKVVYCVGPEGRFSGIPPGEGPGIVDGRALKIGF